MIPTVRRRRLPLSEAAYYAAGTALAMAFLFPLLYIAFRSILPANADALGIGLDSIADVTAENYAAVFAPEVGLLQYALNSILVAVGTALTVTVVSTLAGYALSRYPSKLANTVFVLILTPLVVPYQGLLTPLALVLDRLSLLNSLVGLVLVLSTFQLPLGVFVMRNTFGAIPFELEEAAQIDGASVRATLTKVIIPLSWPGLVTVGLFGFMAGWNDLLTSVVFLVDQSKYTLPIVLTSLSTTVEFGVPIVHAGLLTATACVATAPVVVLFLALQRYYTRGLIAGALK